MTPKLSILQPGERLSRRRKKIQARLLAYWRGSWTVAVASCLALLSGCSVRYHEPDETILGTEDPHHCDRALWEQLGVPVTGACP